MSCEMLDKNAVSGISAVMVAYNYRKLRCDSCKRSFYLTSVIFYYQIIIGLAMVRIVRIVRP